jgi:hypothetical protein
VEDLSHGSDRATRMPLQAECVVDVR